MYKFYNYAIIKSMNKEEELKIIEDMQAVAEQMRLDDIEENPDSEFDTFECQCCGEEKPYAGSVVYEGIRVCNDCVLLAETGFALGKIKNINELMQNMEDKKLEAQCLFIKQNEIENNN